MQGLHASEAREEFVSASELVITAGNVIVLVFPLFRVGRLWRGSADWKEQRPQWWVWGDELWQGVVLRGSPVGLVLWSSGVVTYVLLQTAPKSTATTGCEAVVGLMAVAYVSVVLFNRPSVLVPPRFRRDKGAASRWLRRSSS
jgi:hypothetical protein